MRKHLLNRRHLLREGRMNSKRRMLTESNLGQLKIICDLDNYSPWSGAEDTWNQIVDAGLQDEFESMMADAYPDGISMVDLNDFLWHDSESALEMVGLGDSEEDDEDVDVEITLDNIPEETYAHLTDGHVDTNVVMQDLISANLFDGMTMSEAIDYISDMKYYPTLEDYNDASGENLTEEDVEDSTYICELSSADGYVELPY